MISAKLKLILLACTVVCLLFVPPLPAQEKDRYEFEHPQMGTMFRIVLYAPDEETAGAATDSAFRRIDFLNEIMSDYLEESELNRLPEVSGNGTWVPVSDELFHVIKEARDVSEQTGGAFDITIGPYVKLWRSLNRQHNPSLPDQETLEKAGHAVGFKHIKLDYLGKKAALMRPGMQLDLGGIAKGYAADEALAVLQSYGIQSALVDAGGDITVGDAPPDKKGWQISIPYHKIGTEEMGYLSFSLANEAIATSGDLFQYVEIDGKRYSHIINPQTGLGLTTQSMVTVLAPDGLTADSYASALSVLGPERGSEFIKSKPDIDARFEFREKGAFEVVESPGFEKRYTSN